MARKALVTGAGRNIGAAIAERLAESGFDVTVHVRRATAETDALLDSLARHGTAADLVEADLADRSAFAGALGRIAAQSDVVVNNVALRPIVPFLQTDRVHWDEVFDVTLHAPVELTRLALPHMVANRWGRIISLIGVRAQQGASKRASSSSAKHALIGFTRSIANEFGEYGVTANTVSPGTIVIDRDTDGSSDRLQARHGISALNRFGTPDEVAHAVAFLASDRADYITGQLLGVNGGEFMGL